jgi:hypothetical protein
MDEYTFFFRARRARVVFRENDGFERRRRHAFDSNHNASLSLHPE